MHLGGPFFAMYCIIEAQLGVPVVVFDPPYHQVLLTTTLLQRCLNGGRIHYSTYSSCRSAAILDLQCHDGDPVPSTLYGRERFGLDGNWPVSGSTG